MLGTHTHASEKKRRRRLDRTASKDTVLAQHDFMQAAIIHETPPGSPKKAKEEEYMKMDTCISAHTKD